MEHLVPGRQSFEAAGIKIPLGSADWEKEFLLVLYSVMIIVCSHCSKLSLHKQTVLERCWHLILLNYINIWGVIFLISTTSTERWEIVALLREAVMLIKLQRWLLHFQIEKQDWSAEQNYSICNFDYGICNDHKKIDFFPKIKNILGKFLFLIKSYYL